VVVFNLIGNTSFGEAVKAVLKLTTDMSVNDEILRFISRFKADCVVFGANKYIYIHIEFFLNTQREAPSINQLYVELLEPTNTTKIAAYVAVAKKVSEIFVRTPTTRKNPNRVTATATVTRLFVLSP